MGGGGGGSQCRLLVFRNLSTVVKVAWFCRLFYRHIHRPTMFNLRNVKSYVIFV